MSTLNQDLEFQALLNDAQQAFLGRRAQKKLFLPGTLFYKFTSSELIRSDGGVTPWWSAVEPLDSSDPGLAGTLERAERLGVAPKEFVRARSAVSKHWNSMSGLLVMRLQKPAYGFVGRCAHQRMDDDPRNHNVVYIGGATQVYLPNLSRTEVRKV